MYEAIFGVIDKALGLALNFAEDRPNLVQRELNKLHKLKKNLASMRNLPKAQWDFEVIMNTLDELNAEMDRLNEVYNV